MIVYSYNEKGIFIGELLADKNPLKPNEFLKPKNTTEQKPPQLKKNEVAVFDGVSWSVKPDFRGYKYWLSDGSENLINEVNILPPVNALSEKPVLFEETIEGLRVQEIKNRLSQIDSESIRPLRAIAAGTAVQFDTDKLTALETERKALVDEMVALNG
jgi:hypothetical protein